MTETSDGSSSWWESWIETAKQKSTQTMEFMKRDITEFTETVQQDTASVIGSTAAVLREKLNVETGSTAFEKAKEGISSLLGSLTDSLAGPSVEDDEKEVVMIRDSEPIILDRSQAEIYAIQTNPETFCREPPGPPELYEEWLITFKISDHQDDLSELMINRTEMRNLYSKLVPSAVSHDEFWHRYYYRLHQLKEAENRRAALVRRADQANQDEVSLDWDNGDEVNAPAKDSSSDSNQVNSTEDDDKDDSIKQSDLLPEISNAKEFPENETLNKELNTENQEHVQSLKSKESDDSTLTRDSPAPNSESSGHSSIESSVGEDWEKNFDLDMVNEEVKAEEKTENQSHIKPSDNSPEVGEDWETWE